MSLFVDRRIAAVASTRGPDAREASADFRFPWKRLVTATYRSPLIRKILLEAGYAHKPEDWGYFTPEGLEPSSSSSGSPIRRQVSSIVAAAVLHPSMRFKAELMDTAGARRFLRDRGACAQGWLPGSRADSRQLSRCPSPPTSRTRSMA